MARCTRAGPDGSRYTGFLGSADSGDVRYRGCEMENDVCRRFRFAELATSYFRVGDVCLLCFDLKNLASFDNIRWCSRCAASFAEKIPGYDFNRKPFAIAMQPRTDRPKVGVVPSEELE